MEAPTTIRRADDTNEFTGGQGKRYSTASWFAFFRFLCNRERRSIRQSPCRSPQLPFHPRKLHQQRVSRGVQPAEDAVEVFLRHRRAACRGGTGSGTDVEEYARPGRRRLVPVVPDDNPAAINTAFRHHVLRT